MVNYQQIQEFFKSRLEKDKTQKYVNVSGDTLQDALKQASIELSIPIKKISYEVLEQGSKGMMGFGKKPVLILAYPQQETKEMVDEELDDLAFGGDAKFTDLDGEVHIKRSSEGIYMQITPPVGHGARVTEREALEAISIKTSKNPDRSMIAKLVKRADSQFAKVAEMYYDPTEDAVITYELADMEMKAYVRIRPPGENGSDATAEAIVSFLQANNIVHGFLDEEIQKLADNPIYEQDVLVAEGDKPKDGEDGKVIYNFETDTQKIRLKEIDGRIDYKELNKINNVVEGQVLAKLIPPERGTPGHTVTGKMLPSKDGKTTQLDIGNNVKLSDDRKQAVATANGQVLILGSKISVEPVFVVNGSVNLKTGNVLFLGSVLVEGSVEDGFAVKAAGNIEIQGSVGKCELDAEGDIIVKQGINGKSSAMIKSGAAVYAKFIENANVEAGTYVVVSDGIINSNVSCDEKIICRGKRAAIVGGHLRAAEEINAKTLGSVAGMETILEVGYDPKSKEKLEALHETKTKLEKELEDINLNINTLENTLKTRKQLSEEKANFYENLKERKVDIQAQHADLMGDIEEVNSYLNQLKSNGRISASGYVYTGVRVMIKDAPLEVRNEFKNVTFVSENNMVKVTKYEEADDTITMKTSLDINH
jgi:uncharacterized protein (DUF342 family)